MKARRNIAYMLFVISLMLLVIPVIPHHHHADGRLCLKNEITTNCCGHHHDAAEAPAEHGCDADCITTHLFEQVPGTDEQKTASSDVPLVITLLYNHLPTLILPAETTIEGYTFAYRERLHDAAFVRLSGLRAPPHCA